MKQKNSKKRKKPTIKDVVIVVNSLIQEIQAIKNDIRTLSGLINMYIEFKGDGDSFEEHVNKNKLSINMKKFDINKYYKIRNEIIKHTYKFLLSGKTAPLLTHSPSTSS